MLYELEQARQFTILCRIYLFSRNQSSLDAVLSMELLAIAQVFGTLPFST